MLIVLLALRLAYAQYTSYNAVAGRLPGRCMPGDFDCGFGRCVPITVFHDGKPDCHDGSDEWCFFGQVKCGAYCIDMSQALGCIFSPKCDDSNRQPQWCAVSNQNYVRTLEGSYRCYYNRTKEVEMPPALNYSAAFLKNTNAGLPGFSPQFPTLFPPMPSHTVAPAFTHPAPVNPTPPAHLSRITGLPPLPPPYPTLLPQPTPFNSNFLSTSTQAPVAITNAISGDHTTPSNSFSSSDLPTSTSSTPENQLVTTSSSSAQETQPKSSATPKPEVTTTPGTGESKTTRRRGSVGHIRGRATTTMMPGKVVTHITVTVVDTRESSRGRQPDDLHGEVPPDESQETKEEHEPDATNEEKGNQGSSSSREITTKVKEESEASSPDIVIRTDEGDHGQPSITHIDLSSSGGTPLVITHVSSSKTSPSFPTDQGQDISDGTTKTTAPNVPIPVVVPIQTAGRAGEDMSEAETLDVNTMSGMGTRERCLFQVVNSAKEKYARYECQCAVGEMEVNGVCEGHEKDLAFFKLDVQSACKVTQLTYDQRKWVAIAKLAESLDLPACVRMASNGDAYVNAICGTGCHLQNIQKLLKHFTGDPKKVFVDEAAACQDSSSNYCHRYAECLMNDVRMSCQCRVGTNDTSGGLGKMCVGVPTDNECIMIYGVCLIVYLIILLGILLLIPLLILLLSRCCVGRHSKRKSINPRAAEEELAAGKTKRSKKKGKKGEDDYQHIHAIMQSANAGKAGKDMARLALSDRYKKKSKEVAEKSNNVVKVEDAHPETSTTAISQPNSVPQAVNVVNGANVAVNEVTAIPGTVPAPVAYGETPILDHVPAPSLPDQQPVSQVAAVTPEQPVVPGQNPLAHKTASHQSLTVTEPPKPAIPPSAFSAPTVGNVVSIPAEVSTPRPVAPPLSTPYATPPHVTPPHAPSPSGSLPVSSSATPLPAGATSPHPAGGTSPHPAGAASPHPAGDVVQPLPHPAHPVPSFPVAVEVHRSNDPNGKKLPRTVSTQSVGVQPTIWESYKALGDVYSKQDNLDRKGSSSSLDTLIYSRYPQMSVTLIAAVPPPKAGKTIVENKQPKPPPPEEPPKQPVFVAETMAGEKSSTDDDVQNSAAVSLKKDRTDKSARLAALLGVNIEDTSISSSSVPERPPHLTLQQSDEQIVEEMSKAGIELPIPPKEEPELSIDERIIEITPHIRLPSHMEDKELLDVDLAPVKLPALPVKESSDVDLAPVSKLPALPVKESSDVDLAPVSVLPPLPVEESSDVDLAPVSILPALPVLPDFEITESDSRPKTSKPGRTHATSVISNDVVFVPKKAREHSNALKRASSREKPTRTGSRELLKPPTRTHDSDESDPEVSAFRHFTKTGRFKDGVPLTRRRLRRPERQLSSISEKSAEIAAEAALQQHQTQDYSISAPNTTRSLTEWQRNIPKPLPTSNGSDTQTDVDIPSEVQKRMSPSSSKVLEKQKGKKVQAEQFSKSKSESSIQRRSRLSSMPSTSSAPPAESKAVRERGFVSSPEIPDVTLRRSLDRLDLLEGSPDFDSNRGAFTSRSQVGLGSKVRKATKYTKRLPTAPGRRSEKKMKVPSQTSDDGETVASGSRSKFPRKETAKEVDTPHSSKSSALISRKIATRRQESLSKSAADLRQERSNSAMGRRAKASRSADVRGRRPPWNSSIKVPDDAYKIYHEPFLPEIKTTTRYYEKSRSVVNSPTGMQHTSLSKFSLTSLPPRCNSQIEFSPYFTPGADPAKRPKEDLWWGPPKRF
ncbi:unnamed protein product [Cylicocyclus nassatus]|uniref:Uncharacterized protein n=1 Tax=Cylicocyclus nassatus TaxID=53992 RepID=A0AA36MHV6_CYLNA|nr:unnamed protein product [Cylicocyclus nassatus]